MVIVKVMKRKDASSVMTAIVVALILVNLLNAVTISWANRLAKVTPVNLNWRLAYLQPILSAILQLLVLEILIRLYVMFHDMMVKK